ALARTGGPGTGGARLLTRGRGSREAIGLPSSRRARRNHGRLRRSAADAVAAGALGLVELGVGAADHLLVVAQAGLVGHADADREAEARREGAAVGGLDRDAQAFADLV